MTFSLASLDQIFSQQKNSDYCLFKGQSISGDQLFNHAHQISQKLSKKKFFINLCHDRYYFAVAYFAGVLNNRPNLLPPNQANYTIQGLLQQYPDSVCISDQPDPEKHFFNITEWHPELAIRPAISFADNQITSISFTSGSTGQPKAVHKSWQEFRIGAQLALQQLGLENTELTIVTTVPPQHMFGLETGLFWPLFSNLVVESSRPFFPEDIRKQLAQTHAPCLLVTTPKHLKSCVDADLQWQNVDRILSSTAPMSLELAHQVEDCFNAPLYEIYGSTETLSYASRRITKNPKWRPYPGISITQQATHFTVSGGHLEQPVVLDDQFQIEKNGDFTVIGRSTDLVKVAGKRASLLQLNALLLNIKEIQDGVFFITETERLGALVVSQLSKKQILEALKQSVDPVFLPRPLYFVKQLPRNEVGKLMHSRLDALIKSLLRDKNS